MKKFITIIILMLVLFAFSSCGNNYKGNYEQLDMTTIEREYKENAARAKENYIGTYVKVQGDLYAINTYSNITVHMPDENYISGKRVIICKIKNKKAKEKLKDMAVGDTVIVKGKITKICGLYDCVLDVYEID